MTLSGRAAALRSTALATSLALTVGLAAHRAGDAWAKPKVPLPKPRPIARNACPETAPQPTRTGDDRAEIPRPPRRTLRRPWRRRRASMPPCRRRAKPSHRRPRLPRRRRPRNPTRMRSKTSSSSIRKHKPSDATEVEAVDHRSGRQKACGMADPAQRRQRRVGRTLSRLPCRQSELAVADVPAPAHRGRAVG